MALSKEKLIIAIDYWKLEKLKHMEALEDIIEESVDEEPNLSRINEMTSISKSLDDIDLVISRINQLLINTK
tara:strand:- start:748 stop:963 length:216 start_codon:yes stop_codon:yes gene_type:complete